jgi:hypothetical protein
LDTLNRNLQKIVEKQDKYSHLWQNDESKNVNIFYNVTIRLMMNINFKMFREEIQQQAKFRFTKETTFLQLKNEACQFW